MNVTLDTFLDVEQTGLHKLPPETLLQLLDELCQKWTPEVGTDEAGKPRTEVPEAVVLSLFELSEPDLTNWDVIRNAYQRQVYQALRLYLSCMQADLIDNESLAAIENRRRFARCLETIYYMNDRLTSNHRLRLLLSESVADDRVPKELDLFKFSFPDYGALSPYHCLLLYILKSLDQYNFRRRGQSCWEQIYSAPDDNGVRYPTHAWKYVCSIDQFICRQCDKETHFQEWINSTSGENARRARVYLTTSPDCEFPDYQPCRTRFSFNDAVLDVKNRRAYRFGKDRIPHDFVACRYFNRRLEPEKLYQYENWTDIPTPKFQSILDFQGLAPDVCWVIYLMIGRLLYDVNDLDKWGLILFIKGVANSGKSTIGKLIKSIYSACDVAILSNNIEKKFGMSALLDKYLFICYEVKKNFGLDQGDFQSIITGEEVSVAQKYKDALSVLLKCTGLLLGNETANWVDVQGSMERRMLTVNFPKKVIHSDMNLANDLEAELPALIVKWNEAYHAGVTSYGHTNLWPVLPDYFQQTRKEFSMQVNALRSFINESHLLARGKQQYIPLARFSELYRDYCTTNNMARSAMTADHYKSVFEDEGLVLKKCSKAFDGKMLETLYIIGIGLKDLDAPPEDAGIEGKAEEAEADEADEGEGAGAGEARVNVANGKTNGKTNSAATTTTTPAKPTPQQPAQLTPQQHQQQQQPPIQPVQLPQQLGKTVPKAPLSLLTSVPMSKVPTATSIGAVRRVAMATATTTPGHIFVKSRLADIAAGYSAFNPTDVLQRSQPETTETDTDNMATEDD